MLPDFVIIGAMKCGTSTLAAQLGAQAGIFMTNPKEPNFFSDDSNFARGIGWYETLFADAHPGELKGEASTHYTKRPTYPDCISRMSAALVAPKLIYLIRNPYERAISHYVHEWTMGVISTDIETAINTHPELVSYGCYGAQIEPFVQAFGAKHILVSSLEAMQSRPQKTLSEVCQFLGYRQEPKWQNERSNVNVSSERIKRFPLHDVLIEHPVSQKLRRAFVPQGLRDRIKQNRKMQVRPELSTRTKEHLGDIFMEDYEKLAQLFPNRTDLDASYTFLAK